jgi:hypothetical protein
LKAFLIMPSAVFQTLSLSEWAILSLANIRQARSRALASISSMPMVPLRVAAALTVE